MPEELLTIISEFFTSLVKILSIPAEKECTHFKFFAPLISRLLSHFCALDFTIAHVRV